MKKLGKAWPCLASAILLLAAFPPFHLSLLVFIALTPWLTSLPTRDKAERRFDRGAHSRASLVGTKNARA